MATPKQVMDFRPSKGITTAQSNEHQRRWTEKGWGSAESTGNYDRSRERRVFKIGFKNLRIFCQWFQAF